MDAIDSLPVTDDDQTEEEKNVNEFAFGSSLVDRKAYTTPLIYGGLFLILASGVTDSLFASVMTTTPFITLLVKTMVFIIIVFLMGLAGY